MKTVHPIYLRKEDDGYYWMRGVLKAATGYVLQFCAGLLVLFLLRLALGIGVDSTDRDRWHRSGLKILVDAKTGVEYLSDGDGGLTPRLSSSEVKARN